MFYVYFLKSKTKTWNYIGYTTDLRRRFSEHQKGSSLATRPYRPLELIFYEAYKSKIDAKRREEYLKTQRGRRALKLMLPDTFKNEKK